ncbi:hypothetical protein BCR35DRAFT_10988 [Leucosporidium creatinivorum]|uniref:Uncharacterized protein n=1 Tax=Leucosporidium creatinivorum TaxID=106004 RepID=A0A1Y2G4M6_9BASI|nr:hypothetical protein BCR35DRAFT_10988 [Leucosporidium creatinivorum]
MFLQQFRACPAGRQKADSLLSPFFSFLTHTAFPPLSFVPVPLLRPTPLSLVQHHHSPSPWFALRLSPSPPSASAPPSPPSVTGSSDFQLVRRDSASALDKRQTPPIAVNAPIAAPISADDLTVLLTDFLKDFDVTALAPSKKEKRQVNVAAPVAVPVSADDLRVILTDFLKDFSVTALAPATKEKRDAKAAAASQFNTAVTDFALANGLPTDGLTPAALTGLVATVLSLVTTLLAAVTQGLALPVPLPLPSGASPNSLPGPDAVQSAVQQLALANGLPIGGLDPSALTGLLGVVLGLVTTLLGGLLGNLPIPIPSLPGLPL